MRPKTNPQNNVRQYTEANIELLKTIYNLVKVRGFKLSAARKMINENRYGADRSSVVLDTLISVKEQLQDLKMQLGGLV